MSNPGGIGVLVELMGRGRDAGYLVPSDVDGLIRIDQPLGNDVYQTAYYGFAAIYRLTVKATHFPDEEPNGAWVSVQLMGKSSTAGLLVPSEIDGLTRIDVPLSGGGYRVEFYGPGAIYKILVITESQNERSE